MMQEKGSLPLQCQLLGNLCEQLLCEPWGHLSAARRVLFGAAIEAGVAEHGVV